jgi:hypothetical protein
MRGWGDGHVIAGYSGGEVLGGLRDKPTTAGISVAILSAEVSHGADLAPRTVPAR